jgi:3-hydroxybutyryl-CoA dehydrogenase
MGAGIAEVCARAGVPVVVVELDPDAARAGARRIAASVRRAMAAGRLTEGDADAALASVSVETDLGAVVECDTVIEAIVESEPEKAALFALLDRTADEGCILASNTSSIPIMKLAMATERPELVIGLHFFNPAPVLRLVELVPSLLTSAETVERAQRFAEDPLGRVVIRCPDRAGFVVNALLVPYLLSAVRMVESGFASPEDVDVGMVEGCAHPLGPLALADLIGLDTLSAVAESLYDEFKEPLFAPPPLLSRMVDAGLLGRKTGRGFLQHAGR